MAKKYIEVEPSVRTLAQKSHFLTTTQWNELLKTITKLPAADVVEVVRCKDCLHNRNCEIQYHAQARDDFYCGAAERRTDEETDIS